MIDLFISPVGAAFPHVVMNDPYSTAAGVCKRLAVRLPPRPHWFIDLFTNFTQRFAHLYLTPVDPDEDYSVETWLSHTHYTLAEKDEMRRQELLPRPADLHVGKVFVKDENYLLFKLPRLIISLHKWLKMKTGPFIHIIEREIFKLKCFIKRVPAHMRALHIIAQVTGIMLLFSESDYTAYESHFDEWLELVIIMQVFMYILCRLPGPILAEFLELQELIARATKLTCAQLDAEGIDSEWSGDTKTSVLNGLMNLILYLFLIEYLRGRRLENQRTSVPPALGGIDGNVEGDDAAHGHEADEVLTAEDYASVGFNCVSKVTHRFECTDFVGSIIDPVGQIVTTDVIQAYVNMGWAMSAYIRVKRVRLLELLRAKGFSMMYQYAGSPLLGSLARYVLRCTRNVSLERFFKVRGRICQYDMDQYYEAYMALRHKAVLAVRVPLSTRLLVEERFGFTLDEQRRAEQALDSRDVLRPLDVVGSHHFHPDWVRYYYTYVVRTSRQDIVEGKVTELPPLPTYTNFSSEWLAECGANLRNRHRRAKVGLDAFDI